MTTTIQVRRGTSAQWQASARILLAGEWGAAVDDGEVTSVRIGNGVDTWADLPNIIRDRINITTEPPAPGDGAVGDLWAVVPEEGAP